MAMVGRLVLLLLAGAPNSFAEVNMLRAPVCRAGQQDQTAGLQNQELHVHGHLRRYLLYVPKGYAAEAPLALWVLAPGAYNEPEKQVAMSEFVQFAEEKQFAFIALRGDNNLMNVVRHSRPQPFRPDDVAYTEAVLREVRERLCVDAQRIFCAGYSRGARFCMRLASELPETFAAVAPVSGVRFPTPNNATRPIPIIAFHGTADPINPFKGNGNPEYWYDSVPAAISKWAKFNGCAKEETRQIAPSVISERHSDCRDNADVILFKVLGGGHTWPGSNYNWGSGLGVVTHEIKANPLMSEFFQQHPMPDSRSPCQPAAGSGLAPRNASNSGRQASTTETSTLQTTTTTTPLDEADHGSPSPETTTTDASTAQPASTTSSHATSTHKPTTSQATTTGAPATEPATTTLSLAASTHEPTSTQAAATNATTAQATTMTSSLASSTQMSTSSQTTTTETSTVQPTTATLSHAASTHEPATSQATTTDNSTAQPTTTASSPAASTREPTTSQTTTTDNTTAQPTTTVSSPAASTREPTTSQTTTTNASTTQPATTTLSPAASTHEPTTSQTTTTNTSTAQPTTTATPPASSTHEPTTSQTTTTDTSTARPATTTLPPTTTTDTSTTQSTTATSSRAASTDQPTTTQASGPRSSTLESALNGRRHTHSDSTTLDASLKQKASTTPSSTQRATTTTMPLSTGAGETTSPEASGSRVTDSKLESALKGRRHPHSDSSTMDGSLVQKAANQQPQPVGV